MITLLHYLNKEVKMKKAKHEMNVGDIYAVPLDTTNTRYGYVKTYRGPNIAILPVISSGRLLNIEELRNFSGVRDVATSSYTIEKGKWPLIGNIPFATDDEEWPAPMKQVGKIRPDIKMVVYRGNYITAEKFGEYDNLPVFAWMSDEALINEIITSSGSYHQL